MVMADTLVKSSFIYFKANCSRLDQDAACKQQSWTGRKRLCIMWKLKIQRRKMIPNVSGHIIQLILTSESHLHVNHWTNCLGGGGVLIFTWQRSLVRDLSWWMVDFWPEKLLTREATLVGFLRSLVKKRGLLEGGGAWFVMLGKTRKINTCRIFLWYRTAQLSSLFHFICWYTIVFINHTPSFRSHVWRASAVL